MRGFGGQRQEREAEQSDRARKRLGALGTRSGWVPRVPATARELVMLGVNAERMNVGRSANSRAADTSGSPHRAGGNGHAGVGGTAGTRAAAEPNRAGAAVEGGLGDAGVGGAAQRRAPSASRPAEPGSAGRHRAVGAVTERWSNPLRVLAESLPASIRGGELGLERGHVVVIGLVIALGLTVTLVLTGLGRPTVTPVDPAPGSTVVATGRPVPVGAVTQEVPDETDAGSRDVVVVHVAGKVTSPGIVELPAGSRVIDAVEAAGGANDGVDLSRLNLARVLADGEQVGVGVDPLPSSAPGATDAPPPVVNLNTATAAELEALPGIGPTLAASIVAWRDEHGRFSVVEELQEVSGIGPKTFEALAEQVTV